MNCCRSSLCSLVAAMMIASLTIAIAAGAKREAKEQSETPTDALAAWTDAWLSHDLEAVLARYVDSPEALIINSTGTADRGIDAIRAQYVEAFREVAFENVALKNLKVEYDGDVAWASCRLIADTASRTSGDQWRLEIQTTLVLRNIDGVWRIVQEHSSTIADVPRLTKLG